MDKITVKNKIIILIFGIVLGAGATFGGFALSHKTVGKDAQQEQVSAKGYQDEIAQAEERISELKNQLEEKDKVLKENGSNGYKDLRNTASNFFEIFYNYNQEEVTNRERQEKVDGLSTAEVYEEMFPLSADEIKSDYGYVQSNLDTLEVYPTGLNGKEITALIDASYTIKAGEISSMVQHYMWKVTFDSDTNKIKKVDDMGRLSMDSKN